MVDPKNISQQHDLDSKQVNKQPHKSLMKHTERNNSATSGRNSCIHQTELKTLNYTDHTQEYQIHPENSFFSNINNDCCYYTNEQTGDSN